MLTSPHDRDSSEVPFTGVGAAPAAGRPRPTLVRARLLAAAAVARARAGVNNVHRVRRAAQRLRAAARRSDNELRRV